MDRIRFDPVTGWLGVKAFALLALALLAGCMGQSVTAEGQVVFQGTGAGRDESHRTCSTTVSFGVAGNIASGKATFTAFDGGGNRVASFVLEAGSDGHHREVTGQAGTWTIQVERSSGFAGQYAASLGCPG